MELILNTLSFLIKPLHISITLTLTALKHNVPQYQKMQD